MSTRFLLKPALLAFVAFALTLGGAAAAPLDDDERHEVRVERKVICDGDDCSEGPGDHTMIFIDEDGNRQTLEGDFSWFDADGGPMKMKFHGLGRSGAFLGVGLTDLTPELRSHFGVPDDAGVMVSRVVEDSPAQQAGIEVGDIIALVDSNEVGSARALSRAIGSREEGDTVTLEIWRDGAAQRLSATLEEREGTRMAVMPRIHMRHGGDGERIERRIHVECDSDDAECGAGAGVGDYDCGGAETCEVRVQCEAGDCTCTVNGEAADCADIPGVPQP